MRKLLNYVVVSSMFFIAALNNSAAQEANIRDIVLYDRKFHLLVKSDEFLIVTAPNSGIMPVLNDLEHGSENTFGSYYDFSIIPFENNPVLVSYEVRQIQVVSGKRSEILASDILEYSIQRLGILGMIELGAPLVEANDVSRSINSKEVDAGLHFESRQFADVCTSFYIPPSAAIIFQRPPRIERDWHSATFFISSDEFSERCFNQLFLDLIGLRGLAVQTDLSSDRVVEALGALKLMENNHVFLNSD